MERVGNGSCWLGFGTERCCRRYAGGGGAASCSLGGRTFFLARSHATTAGQSDLPTLPLRFQTSDPRQPPAAAGVPPTLTWHAHSTAGEAHLHPSISLHPQLMRNLLLSCPCRSLAKASGVAFLFNFRMGVGITLGGGRGFVMSRLPNGGWSAPLFITVDQGERTALSLLWCLSARCTVICYALSQRRLSSELPPCLLASGGTASRLRCRTLMLFCLPSRIQLVMPWPLSACLGLLPSHLGRPMQGCRTHSSLPWRCLQSAWASRWACRRSSRSLCWTSRTW